MTPCRIVRKRPKGRLSPSAVKAKVWSAPKIGVMRQRRELAWRSAQFLPNNSSYDAFEGLPAALDVVAEHVVDQGLVVAAARSINLGPEPREDIVVQTDGDPGLAFGERHDGPTSPSGKIVLLAHRYCSCLYCRSSVPVAHLTRINPDFVESGGPADDQHPANEVEAQRDEPVFFRMRVVHGRRIRILEDSNRVRERHAFERWPPSWPDPIGSAPT